MEMNIEEIKDKLVLRYPYLLVDRVISLEQDSIKAMKNVTINEPFFQGHFPEPYPSVMPGTMIIEGMAQVAGLLTESQTTGQTLGYLVGVEDAKFRKQIKPGDQITYNGKIKRSKGAIYKVEVTAKVDGKLAASSVITLAYSE